MIRQGPASCPPLTLTGGKCHGISTHGTHTSPGLTVLITIGQGLAH